METERAELSRDPGMRRRSCRRDHGLVKGGARALLFLGVLCAAPFLEAQPRPYVVVVNAENPVSAMPRAQVATLFLDRTSRWKGGFAAAPVDQSLTSPIREAFSKDVLGLTLPEVKNYWSKRMISAREFPPPVKSSDEEVIVDVAKNKGGIGYVSAAAPLQPGVKVLRVLE